MSPRQAPIPERPQNRSRIDWPRVDESLSLHEGLIAKLELAWGAVVPQTVETSKGLLAAKRRRTSPRKGGITVHVAALDLDSAPVLLRLGSPFSHSEVESVLETLRES